MSCIVDYCYVNPEDLPDTPEAYATLAAEKLTDGGIYNILSVYQDDGYTESLSYPVYIVSFTSGNNEDTNFWLAFMVIRDGYTYLCSQRILQCGLYRGRARTRSFPTSVFFRFDGQLML